MYETEAASILRAESPGFSWDRVTRALFEERTCTVEIILGLVFILVRGMALLGYSYYTPGIEFYLAAVGLKEETLGWLCVFLGLAHLYGAGTYRFRIRAWIAASGILLSVAVIFAVSMGAPVEAKPIAVIWLSILITEIYLAFRNWLARDAAKVVLQRNGLA